MKFIRRDPRRGYVDTHLWVPKSAVNVESTKQALTHLLSNTQGETRYLELYQETDNHLVVPRAFWKLTDLNVDIVDCRPREFPKVNIQSRIVLDFKEPNKSTQRDAVNAVLAAQDGILQLGCGKGKTCCALHIASILQVPTLIIVPNTELMEQWLKEIDRHMCIPDGVGIIRQAKCEWQHPIVVSTYQTLAKRADKLEEEIKRWFGFTVMDEGHHSSAPYFSRVNDLTYGKRLLLTATPERRDGAQVVYFAHVGEILYKDITQDLIPHVEFLWSDLRLDEGNKKTMEAVCDKKGEIHLSKLASYFGGWQSRLDFILAHVRRHVANGRKILVLSNSVGELVNLFNGYNGQPDRYTDIVADNGSTGKEKPMHKEARKRYEAELARYQLALLNRDLSAVQREYIRSKVIPSIESKLELDGGKRKDLADIGKKQQECVKRAIAVQSDAGLLVRRVPKKARKNMLRTKRVTFAIYQYGVEGLDDVNLDTIIACEPLTSNNALHQFFGRALRKNGTDKHPLIQFIEDDIGPIMGMCSSVRRQLSSWPADEGGPYKFTLVDHPSTRRQDEWMQRHDSVMQTGRSWAQALTRCSEK